MSVDEQPPNLHERLLEVDPIVAPAVDPAVVPAVDRARPDAPSDRFMRRLLLLPEGGARASAAEARSAFQTSIAVATVRCLLMYIVFPFVLPAVGVASGVGPVIGLVISVVAIVAITMSVRRFWRADHSKRWHYTAVGGVVMVFMAYLIVRDLITLVG